MGGMDESYMQMCYCNIAMPPMGEAHFSFWIFQIDEPENLKTFSLFSSVAGCLASYFVRPGPLAQYLNW